MHTYKRKYVRKSPCGVHAVPTGCMTSGRTDWTDRIIKCMQRPLFSLSLSVCLAQHL